MVLLPHGAVTNGRCLLKTHTPVSPPALLHVTQALKWNALIANHPECLISRQPGVRRQTAINIIRKTNPCRKRHFAHQQKKKKLTMMKTGVRESLKEIIKDRVFIRFYFGSTNKLS